MDILLQLDYPSLPYLPIRGVIDVNLRLTILIHEPSLYRKKSLHGGLQLIVSYALGEKDTEDVERLFACDIEIALLPQGLPKPFVVLDVHMNIAIVQVTGEGVVNGHARISLVKNGIHIRGQENASITHIYILTFLECPRNLRDILIDEVPIGVGIDGDGLKADKFTLPPIFYVRIVVVLAFVDDLVENEVLARALLACNNHVAFLKVTDYITGEKGLLDTPKDNDGHQYEDHQDEDNGHGATSTGTHR